MKELNFALTKEIQINFCTYDLALSNCHTCDNRMPKRPVIENKLCDNWCAWARTRAIARHSWSGLNLREFQLTDEFEFELYFVCSLKL